LNPRSARVYGADGHETVDALLSLRLRKREQHEVLRRMRETSPGGLEARTAGTAAELAKEIGQAL
jgi:hypothetical protein